MKNNDRTLSETELDRISGGLRDRPWVDYLNHQNRLDGGGFGKAIAGNWMWGGKDASDPGQIGNNVPVHFNPDAPF